MKIIGKEQHVKLGDGVDHTKCHCVSQSYCEVKTSAKNQRFFLLSIMVCGRVSGVPLLKDAKNLNGGDMLNNGNSPKWGEVWKNIYLADVYKVGLCE